MTLGPVCELLLPDVMVPEVHQNDCSYIRELGNLLSIHHIKNFTWLAATWRTSKNTELSKLGGSSDTDGVGYGIPPRNLIIMRS